MKKRFTDIHIWKKPWFYKLDPFDKLMFMYIKDECDEVGVWEQNFERAESDTKTKIVWDDFLKKCNGNIKILNNNKWWLVKFCNFQYKKLDEKSNSPTTKSYIDKLKYHKLWDLYLEMEDT